MTTKSIIGRKYVANGTKAIDLNLKQELALGDYKYTIIADPYVCEYTRPTYPVMSILEGFQREVKMIAVNVLDDRTGLTYAVEYHPANLVCEDRTTNQPETPVDFATRAQQIADELKVVFDSAGEGFSDSAVLHSLQFRTTETIKLRPARAFSAVEEIWSRRRSPLLVPKIPKSSKS